MTKPIVAAASSKDPTSTSSPAGRRRGQRRVGAEKKQSARPGQGRQGGREASTDRPDKDDKACTRRASASPAEGSAHLPSHAGGRRGCRGGRAAVAAVRGRVVLGAVGVDGADPARLPGLQQRPRAGRQAGVPLARGHSAATSSCSTGRPPGRAGRVLIKRVIGLPGDTVERQGRRGLSQRSARLTSRTSTVQARHADGSPRRRSRCRRTICS